MKNEDDLYPIKAEYNKVKDEIVICTRKDVRFISMRDGRISKMFTGLLINKEDEIAQFKSIN